MRCGRRTSARSADEWFRISYGSHRRPGIRIEATTPGRRSFRTEGFDDERRVDDHVRRDGMIGDRMNPSVAGAKRDDGLDHARTGVAEKDEDERQRGIAQRFKRRPALDKCMTA